MIVSSVLLMHLLRRKKFVPDSLLRSVLTEHGLGCVLSGTSENSVPNTSRLQVEETSLELKHSPVIKVGEKYNYYKDNVWYQVQIHKILYDDIVIGKNLNKIGKKKFFKVDPQDLRREDMVDSGISDCFCSSSDASLQAEKQ